MIKSPKAVEVIGDAGALLLALAVSVLTLVVTLRADTETVRALGLSLTISHVEQSLLVWFLVAVFCIALVEGVGHVLQANARIDSISVLVAARDLKTRSREPLRALVITRGLTTGLILAAVSALLLAVCVSYVVSNSVAPTGPTAVLLATYLVYGLARRPVLRLLRRVAEPLARWSRSSMATVTVERDGVAVDLAPTGLRREGSDSVMHIGFGELDQVQMLTYREAEAFRAYEVGPNLTYAQSHVQNLYRFARGEAERMDVYLPQLSTSGPVLLLRGPKIFYLINVPMEPPGLLQAFRERREA